MIYDDINCILGEGPLWHPTRNELFWFDIMAKKLHRKGESWQFDEHVSAAGWVDDDTLVIATSSALLKFTISTGESTHLIDLEADNSVTRCNDGRADNHGGFWIGTMGLEAEAGAGSIYRFYKGELRLLYPNLTIPNSICFSPDGTLAYYADTRDGCIMRQDLDAEGWPTGAPVKWLDLTGEGLNPDGSDVDAKGNVWNAQWGAGRVACYAPDGTFVKAYDFPAAQTTCPAFGGDDLTTLLCTSASAGLDQNHLATRPHSGQTFAQNDVAKGQPAGRVILS